MKTWALAAVCALCCGVACEPSEHRAAREHYNDGVDALAGGQYDAAEKALLDARSNAGVDPELQFRAAYDLGLAYAAHADQMKSGKDADLGKALELERQAVMWFDDAARHRPDDADAKANLATVRARVAALTDELGRGKGKLEARLDAVIDAQRELLDQTRGAWLAIKTAGGADPLAQADALGKLADKERGIVAEAGVIGDLAADEIDAIGKKPEDKRTQDEAARVVQLKNLDIYLMEGRTKIAEARRALQDLAAEDGVTRADAALTALKRAREQLLDPIAVLRELGQAELQLMQETAAVDKAIGKPSLTLGSAGAVGSAAAQPLVPAWLEPPALGDAQAVLGDRAGEIRARLQAGVDSADQPQGSGAAAEPPKLSPEQAKIIAHVRAALPHVSDAAVAMSRAQAALKNSGLGDAQVAERLAVQSLAKAVEEFADLKQTIDLAYNTQQQAVALLSPVAAQLPPAERAVDTEDAVATNVARVARIKDQIADQLAELDAKAAGSGAGSDQDQLAQARQQLTMAESLRGDAAKLLDTLGDDIAKNRDPLASAMAAEAKLAELRKLFFSVIEHLQELVREQGETRDQTAQADAEDDFTREPKLPQLSKAEAGHGQMADAIVEALAKQADAAAKQAQQAQQGSGAGLAAPQQGQPQYAAAADEVRAARVDMTGAQTTLDKAVATKTQSISLAPSVDHEAKAIEHFKKALELLQPPQQNKDDKNNKDQQQQQQQNQKDQKDQKDQKPGGGSDDNKPKPPEPAGGAGQRVRDEDAKRQRDKQAHQAPSDPVDQDW